jgi:hypothetical protein
VLATVAVLLAASATRTIDPVSRRLWGTFRFGEHELLRATSMTRECCGYGRDQLVYNLQFTAFAEAQDALYAQLRPGLATAFVVQDYANLHTIGLLDARTGRRTLRRAGVIQPGIVPASMVINLPMQIADGWSAWFVEFPNMWNDEPLAGLRRRFDVGPAVWARTPDGYAMAAYPLRERPRPTGRAIPR